MFRTKKPLEKLKRNENQILQTGEISKNFKNKLFHLFFSIALLFPLYNLKICYKTLAF